MATGTGTGVEALFGVASADSGGDRQDGEVSILGGVLRLDDTLVVAPGVIPVRRRERRRRTKVCRGDVLVLFKERRRRAEVGDRDYGMLPGGGIDLGVRGHEVRKILYKCFGHKMLVGGHDPEEVLSEVYRGILVRNEGKCPWDPAKSGFGHYVYMVCSGVLVNYHQRARRRQGHEQVGYGMYVEGEWTEKDIKDNKAGAGDADLRRVLSDCAIEVGLETGIPRVVVEGVLEMLREGHRKTVICQELKVSKIGFEKIADALRVHLGA